MADKPMAALHKQYRSSLNYFIFPHETANYFQVPSLIASPFSSDL